MGGNMIENEKIKKRKNIRTQHNAHKAQTFKNNIKITFFEAIPMIRKNYHKIGICVLLVCFVMTGTMISIKETKTSASDTFLQPHSIYGYAYYEGGTPATGATVNIQNLDTGAKLDNVYTVASNGYFIFDTGSPGPGWGDGQTVKVTIIQEGTTEYQWWSGSGTVVIDETQQPQQMNDITLHPPSPPNKPSKPTGPTQGEPGTSYTYSTSSTDPNGLDVKYGWDWDGDGNVDEWTDWYTSGETCSVSHTFSRGVYNIKVKAKNTGSQESSFSDALTVYIDNAPNTPTQPSGETSGYHCTSYSYSTSSSDPDGDNLYYLFDWGDGSNSGWLGPYASGETVTAEYSWDEPGTYQVKAKAKDELGLESDWSSSITVTMDNHPPTTPSQPTGPTSGYTGVSYTFETSATDSDSCDQIKYGWDWNGDGNVDEWSNWYASGETCSMSHTFSGQGTYNIKVKASDGWDGSDWSSPLQIEISESLEADADGPYEGGVNQKIQFYGSVSGGNPPYEWHWNFGDGATSNEQNPKHAYSSVGTYDVTLTVYDSEDDSASDTTTAVVRTGLIADAGGPYFGYVNESIQFYGNATGGTPPYEWLWLFEDGNTSEEQNPVHVYTKIGNYNATLIAIDSTGQQDSDTAIVTITERPINHPPNKPDKPSGSSQGKVGIPYKCSTSTVDPDGDKVKYGWDWNGDDKVDTWTDWYDSGEVCEISHTFDEKATYYIKVKAQDEKGDESEWSDPLPVKIPKPPSHPFLEMIWKIFTMIARAFLPLLAALPIQLPLIAQWRKK